MSLDKIIRELTSSVVNTAQMTASFSQLGEDRVLSWYFGQRRNGFYVDVGCHHPYRYSNTAMLHILNDWTGVNVDVDERSIAAFKEARPQDLNLCKAIGGEVGRLELTLFEGGAINTFDPTMAANPIWAPTIMEKRIVDVIPLRDLMQANVPDGQKIDLLNIDIEGLDYAALASNDWERFAPEVIAVEVHGFDPANPSVSPTFQLLTSLGYDLLAHMVVTSIFTRKSI